MVWDSENRLVICNSRFQHLHNLPSEAVVAGAAYAEVMARGTAPLIHLQVFPGEAAPFGARTFEAQLADGRWLQINDRFTRDGGHVSVGTDITELKRKEAQLILSEAQLRASFAELDRSHQTLEQEKQKLIQLAEQYLAQKTEAEQANLAKSNSLADMQHELLTPLNAILGFSEIMMLEAFGTLGAPQYVDYSKDIHTSGQILRDTISNLLDKSRLEAGRSGTADIDELQQRAFIGENVVLLDEVRRQIEGFDRKREEVDRAIGKLKASISSGKFS